MSHVVASSTYGQPNPEPIDWADVERDDDNVRDLEAERQRLHCAAVEAEARRLRIAREARDLVEAERLSNAAVPPFDADTLGRLLTRPAAPPFRVEELIPAEGGTLIVAARKCGKTTFGLNLVDSLITGRDFLGRFGVRRVDGNVGLLNFEVSAAQLARWADEVGVAHDRLVIVNLRGRRNPFAHPEDRQSLASWLRGHDVEALITDPFGRAYTGKSQNDPGEVGAWLAELDRFVRADVGATDVVLSAHAGWEGERTRGSSALEDWADDVITLTKDDEGARYLRAFGRDVEIDEDRLRFEPTTRALTLTGAGSRKTAAIERRALELVPEVLDHLAEHPGASQRQVETALKNRDARKALKQLVDDGRVITAPKTGRGGGVAHYLNESAPKFAEPRERATEVREPRTYSAVRTSHGSQTKCAQCAKPVTATQRAIANGWPTICGTCANTNPASGAS